MTTAMELHRLSVLVGLLLASLPVAVLAQKPYLPPAFLLKPMLPSSIQAAPTVVPNIFDKTAPDAQKVCHGYKLSNTLQSSNGLTGSLALAGPACNVYGNDVSSLSLIVEYQSKERLSVKIQPSSLSPQNESMYLLSGDITPVPGKNSNITRNDSDLAFSYSNNPSFQFRISRRDSGEVLFDTYGSVLVFEDQFLEMRTKMIKDYNVYGLPESLWSFRMGNNFTQSFWNSYFLNNDQQIGVNLHSAHPVYLETRYANGSSTSHGVYARNAHGQDWLLRDEAITYRTIGGTFDLYFLSGSTPNVSGSTPKDVIAQYQTQIVQTPQFPAYWHLGFFQTRWGYLNWTDLQNVVDAFAATGIQLEGVMSDLDYLDLNRPFTTSPGHYDPGPGKTFLDKLHAAGQYYLPILNSEVYVPNAGESYTPYTRGKELDVFMKAADGKDYVGVAWAGLCNFVDFLSPNAQQYWTEQFQAFHDEVAYDGWWLDISDPTSWCTGDCGKGKTEMNPIHVPFALPGDPNTSQTVNYKYPEMFAVTNLTEAVSASAALASQSLAYPTTMPPNAPIPRTVPEPGVRNLTFPPYAIANLALMSHSLVEQVVSPDAYHSDGHKTTAYAAHNVYGLASGKATYRSLLEVHKGRRPWFLSRSTFPGSGAFGGHWGGDTNSNFADMYQGISQALRFAIAGIPYFGVDSGGLNGNADFELIARWQQLSAWFPFYRNHNNRNTIPQEPYRWAVTIEATKRIMDIRYSLLPYTYTLFHEAHSAGETVLRALAWEFPNDESLKAVETQFMSGPAILVTPVLVPLATKVQGIFPGIVDGTIWYDWYTLAKVDAKPGENKTLDAPLTHQPIFVRGGYVVPTQKPGNTTATSRKSEWSLLIAADKDGKAVGSLYQDDGISLEPTYTKEVKFSYTNATLNAVRNGLYQDYLPLANLTIAGFGQAPKSVTVTQGGKKKDTSCIKWTAANGALFVTGLAKSTSPGAWTDDLVVQFT